MRIKIVLAAGLTLSAIVGLMVLLHSPATVAATNGVQPTTTLATASADISVCQSNETLPARASAILLQLNAVVGPRVTVKIFDGARLITHGTQGTGWYGAAVIVPLTPTSHTFVHVRLCFQLSLLSGYVGLLGTGSSPSRAATVGTRSLSGRISTSYLRPGRASWLSQIGTVLRHMGMGRAAGGTWIALPIAALIGAALALASWVLVKEVG